MSSAIVGFTPVYDRWSNEGGGRAEEMSRRVGEQRGLDRARADYAREDAGLKAYADHYAQAYEKLKSDFVAKYGDEWTANKTLAVQTQDGGDAVSLSADAKAFLKDFQAVEKARAYSEVVADVAVRVAKAHASMSKLSQLGLDNAANTYDSRFTVDDAGRRDAYARLMAGIENSRTAMQENIAEGAAWRASVAAREQADAALAPNGDGALFSIGKYGRIDIDARVLENIKPGSVAVTQLASLINLLTQRNGLDQLRTPLIAAMTTQNSAIAQRTVSLSAANQ